MSNKFVVEGGLSIPSGKQLELNGVSLSAISNDPNLAGNSQSELPTEYAVKSYIDAHNQFTLSTTEINGSTYTVEVDDTINFQSDNALTWTLTEDNVALALEVDDSSIEIDADNGVQVKAEGITNAMLAGSIESSKVAELSAFSTTDLDEGNKLYYTDERVDDRISTMLVDGSGLTKTYDDTANTLTLDVSLSEATVAVVDPAADSLLFIDADGNGTRRDSWADYASAVAGAGITATNGSFSVTTEGVTNAMLAGSIESSKVAELSAFDTDGLGEGSSNLYYTNDRVYTALSVSDSTSVDMTMSAAGDFSAVAIVDDASIEINADNGLQVKSGGISNDMLGGSIANNKLTNSALSAGGVELTLGSSVAQPAFDLTGADSYPGDASLVTTGALNSGSITSGFGTIDIGTSTLDCGDISGDSITMTGFTVSSTGITTVLSGSQLSSDSADAVAEDADIANKAYVDSKVGNADLDLQGDTGGALAVDLDSQTLSIVGTTNEIETAGSGQTITVGLPNDVTIGNDLSISNDATVTGTMTQTGKATFAVEAEFNGGIDCDGQLSMETNNIVGTADDMLLQSGTITSDYDWSTGSGHMALQSENELVLQSGNRLENDFSTTMDNTTDGNTMFSFDGDVYDSAKVHIRMSDGTDTTTREILIATNAAGTSAKLISYGVVSTGASDIDGTFTVTVTDTNTVNLVCTQTSGSTNTVVGHYQMIK